MTVASRDLSHLLRKNRKWSREIRKKLPGFLQKLAGIHAPRYLWIGCSDSRVPANEIVGLLPGQMFVHRNIANLVIHTDFNCLAVIQYAVEVLGIRDIIVCGHYGCGGIRAAVENKTHGLIDNWLRNVQEIMRFHQEEIGKISDAETRLNRLCELNVIRQTLNVGDTTIIQEAWKKGKALNIHGWVYSLTDGLLKDLGTTISSLQELQQLEDTLY